MNRRMMTPDELEGIAFDHGGNVERNEATGLLTLQTKMGGHAVTLYAQGEPTKAAS